MPRNLPKKPGIPFLSGVPTGSRIDFKEKIRRNNSVIQVEMHKMQWSYFDSTEASHHRLVQYFSPHNTVNFAKLLVTPFYPEHQICNFRHTLYTQAGVFPNLIQANPVLPGPVSIISKPFSANTFAPGIPRFTRACRRSVHYWYTAYPAHQTFPAHPVRSAGGH